MPTLVALHGDQYAVVETSGSAVVELRGEEVSIFLRTLAGPPPTTPN